MYQQEESAAVRVSTMPLVGLITEGNRLWREKVCDTDVPPAGYVKGWQMARGRCLPRQWLVDVMCDCDFQYVGWRLGVAFQFESPVFHLSVLTRACLVLGAM